MARTLKPIQSRTLADGEYGMLHDGTGVIAQGDPGATLAGPATLTLFVGTAAEVTAEIERREL
jgi:hypothetical protein